MHIYVCVCVFVYVCVYLQINTHIVNYINILRNKKTQTHFKFIAYANNVLPDCMEVKPELNVKTLFTAVIYEFLYYDRVFVPGRPIKPSSIFVGKDRAYHRCFTLR
jgi:hypothetical protein